MLNKLKGLFFEDDGKTPAAETAPQIEQKQVTESTDTNTKHASSNVPAPSSRSQVQTSGKPNPKFVEVLLKAIEANNIDGFDYLEFKQSLQNLSKMDMDEATRYKSAFAMAQTMGVSPSKLVNSANHYIGILKKEEVKFQSAMKNQLSKQVTQKQESIKTLQQNLLSKQKQIEKLTQEIEADKEKLNQMKSTIDQSAAKVESTKIGFINAYNNVLGQIKTDVEKINRYIT